LTRYGDLAKWVIYAGAAPGTHIPFLAYLFPEHHFILIDPSEFELKNLQHLGENPKDPKDPTNPMNRLEIVNGYFTNELAEKYSKEKKDVLFISDTRSANPREQEPELVEKLVLQDNAFQKN